MNKINLNELISSQSGSLFRLDDLGQYILSWISSQGSNTIYGIGNLATQYNRDAGAKSRPTIRASHASVHRTVRKLVEDGYLQPTREEPTNRIPGQMKRYYDITSKGFLASLGKTGIDQTKCFGSNADEIAKFLNSRELAKTAVLFLKTCLATWFQWHLSNGITLSNLIDATLYRALSRVPTIAILERTRQTSDRLAIEGISPGILHQDFTEKDLIHCLEQAAKEKMDILTKLIALRLAVGTKFIADLSREQQEPQLKENPEYPLKEDTHYQESSLKERRLMELTQTAVRVDRLKDHMGGPSDSLTKYKLNDEQVKAFYLSMAKRLSHHKPKSQFEIAIVDESEPTASENIPIPMDLETALTRIREYIIDRHWLEFYTLPEKEIIQLYDSDLCHILEQ